MGSGAGPRPDSGPAPEPIPITPDVLADLQAGLLDDATAAGVRRRARDDPAAARILARLNTVRLELAHLGSDEDGAPDLPGTVTAAVVAALRTAPPPSPPQAAGHALARARLTRAQWAGLGIGILMVTATAFLGAPLLGRAPVWSPKR